MGGWPTIRYFNKDTGYDGASYTQKTSGAMCDELGDVDNMQAYVMEAGQTSLCSIDTKIGCSEKESGYIDKMQTKTPADRQAQLDRLLGMTGKSMKDSLKQWLGQRLAILKQFARDTEAHSEL
jgi:hypothetical protein